jgi:hypothetical protein
LDHPEKARGRRCERRPLKTFTSQNGNYPTRLSHGGALAINRKVFKHPQRLGAPLQWYLLPPPKLGSFEHCCAISVARVRAALTASIPRSNRPLARRTNFRRSKKLLPRHHFHDPPPDGSIRRLE